MSKLYRAGEPPENTHVFNFQEFTEPETEKESSVKEEFLADKYGEKKAEFIPGGFDFDYEGGLRRDEIMNRSLDEANKIVEEAKQQVANIKEQSKNEGYKEGREIGYKEGLELVNPVIESFKAAIEEVTKVRGEFYAQAEKEMIDLVINVVNVVIGLEMERNPSLVHKVILKAVLQLKVREEMTIRINPKDLEEAEKVLPALSKQVEDMEKVSLKTDPMITRGGCMVETNIGMIDARVESQLEALRQSFIQAFTESEAKKEMESGNE